MRFSTPRSIALVLIAAAVLLHQFVFMPARRSLLAARAATEKKLRDAAELDKLCARYRDTARAAGVRRVAAPAGFSLIAFVGEQVERLDLKANVKEVNPLPPRRTEDAVVERVGVALEGVTMEKIYALLERVELGTSIVTIPTFQMKRDRDRQHTLSCEMELCVVRQAAPAPSAPPARAR